MTSLTDTQVITASGGLVELGYSEMTSGFISVPVTAATSPTTILSDMSVVCDGGPIVIEFFAPIVRPGTAAGNILYINLYQDGAELDRGFGYIETPVAGSSWNPVHLTRRITPTAGLHTFSIRAYSVGNAGSISGGSGGTGFSPAFLRVSKIVTATQWPAVTTGTIICTSSTRPAAPFEGQTIYETDTDLRYTYSGSAWVMDGGLGGWTWFTPQLRTGTTNRTSTVLYARYMQMGKTITVQAAVTATAAGGASEVIKLGLPSGLNPVNASPDQIIGTFQIKDAGTAYYSGVANIVETGYVSGTAYNSANNMGASAPAFTMASNDVISYAVTYEIA
jgi:hypothetical protein